MESWDDRNGLPRGHGAARHVSRAVAERERGRRRLNTATATVGVASLLAAGAVAAALPGSTSKHRPLEQLQLVGQHGHRRRRRSGPGCDLSERLGQLGLGRQHREQLELPERLELVELVWNSSNSSNSSSGSSNLQAPVNQPVQSNGGGQVTSGGSH